MSRHGSPAAFPYRPSLHCHVMALVLTSMSPWLQLTWYDRYAIRVYAKWRAIERLEAVQVTVAEAGKPVRKSCMHLFSFFFLFL